MSDKAEDEICERTLRRLHEHSEALGVSIEQALKDVIPDTRRRLEAYIARRPYKENTR